MPWVRNAFGDDEWVNVVEQDLRFANAQANQALQGLQGNVAAMGQAQAMWPPAAAWQNIGPLNPIPQPVYPPMPPDPEIPEIVEDPDMKLLNKFLVGCDPEFMAIQDNNYMNVKGIIPRAGQVGWDHDGKVIELRPTPAKSTYTLIKKIATLFQTTKFPTAKLRAGAFFNEHTLGGHVHLDVIVDHMYAPRINALDKLTQLLENLDILSKQESHARRAKRWAGWHGAYGQFSDCKVNHGRLEYRTMASWLYSPITSYLCLTGAKLACVDPLAAIQQLDAGKVSSGKLIRFFEMFAGTDYDAKRVVEKLLEPDVKLQRDPNMNLLTIWDTKSADLKLLEAA
jgi:Phage phiEco32-like COOH.NH2 ligase-type 2